MERIWVNSVVTSCGTTESIELGRPIKATVWISCSRVEGGMEVEEKHIQKSSEEIKTNSNRAPLRNTSERLRPSLQALGRLPGRNAKAAEHKRGMWI